MYTNDPRIIVVTGKGGVGKTTVSAALAMKAASEGRRVLVVEAAGAERVAALFGLQGRSYSPRKCAENLYTLSITAEEAIEDYVLLRIKVRALYRIAFRNRVMGPFINAVPGLNDLVHLGKIFHLEASQKRGRPEWDLIVFDAPATGHGLTMLSSPKSMMAMTRTGAFHDNVAPVAEVFSDPKKTQLVLVANSDEMVINETLDLYELLGEMQQQVSSIVLNECLDQPIDAALWSDVSAEFGEHPELVDLAQRAIKRNHDQREAEARLQIQTERPVAMLPFLFNRDLSLGDLEKLAYALGGHRE